MADVGPDNRAAMPADEYDALPYIAMPVVHTQPARLAAMARMFGHRAPIARTARVLELGCASGGNIIPLADRFPEARFLGLDLAARHVRDGQRRVAALGLRNIEIRQADIATVDLGDVTFDYVVCHGVYSWVPPAARQAILRLCARHLAPDGVATISYNVLPGWHLRQVVRDLCLMHAGDGRPHERVARARAVLAQVAAVSTTASPYGHLLVEEARRLARMPASYIAGEFLSAHNEPCRFEQFVAHAEQHGLRYLCECDAPSSSVAMMAPAAAAAIREAAADDPLKAQHYLDHFTGRTFRRSVLVRASAARSVDVQSAGDRLDGLHFAGAFTVDAVPAKNDVARFKDHRGRPIASKSVATARMLRLLGDRYPCTIACSELLDVPAKTRDRVRRNLLDLIVAGQVTMASEPLIAGSATVARPLAWPLARAEAATRQPWVTSLMHLPVLVPPRVAFLARHMDGSRDRRHLANLLADAFGAGDAALAEPIAAGAPEGKSHITQALSDVDRAIAYLARRAVLLPQG